MGMDEEQGQDRNAFMLSEHKFTVSRLLTTLAVKCAAQTGEILGLDRAGRYNLEMAVEEGFLNAVDHYSATPEPGEHILLRFVIEPGRLVVSLCENGIPFSLSAQETPCEIRTDSLDALEQPGLGMRLLYGAMDEVRLISHGRAGKELRMVKNLNPQDLPRDLLELLHPAVGRKRRRTAVNPQISLAREEDIPAICRLAWRCYNYTQDSVLYMPEKLLAKMRTGEIVMFIAKSGGDEQGRDAEDILYHLALKYDGAMRDIPEVGYAFADPAWRCGGLTARMGKTVYDHARAAGGRGVYTRCLTNHLHSQRGTSELGSVPCSMHYGIAPVGIRHKLPGATQQEKGSTLNYYLAFDRRPCMVFLPPSHQDMSRKIYDWLELPREFGCGNERVEQGVSSVIFDPLPKEFQAANIIVDRIGPESLRDIVGCRKKALREKMDATYLFLPADNPNTPALAAAAEGEGYSFAGVMPHIHGGADRLLMQQLNIDLDLDQVLAYGREGQELSAYVRAELERQ